jgi:hypothetical protein
VTVTGVACADGYAAGSLTDNASGVTGGFMLQAVDGTWQQMSSDALTALGKTDLPAVLEQGCYDDSASPDSSAKAGPGLAGRPSLIPGLR